MPDNNNAPKLNLETILGRNYYIFSRLRVWKCLPVGFQKWIPKGESGKCVSVTVVDNQAAQLILELENGAKILRTYTINKNHLTYPRNQKSMMLLKPGDEDVWYSITEYAGEY